VQNPELPAVRFLHVDQDGLLWIVLGAKDKRWRKVDPAEMARLTPEQAARLMSELGDIRLEVIDPSGPRVLASEFVDEYPGSTGTSEPYFFRFVPGSRKSYRSVMDAKTGLLTVQLFDVSLVRK
jgi:hypothetical protein